MMARQRMDLFNRYDITSTPVNKSLLVAFCFDKLAGLHGPNIVLGLDSEAVSNHCRLLLVMWDEDYQHEW